MGHIETVLSSSAPLDKRVKAAKALAGTEDPKAIAALAVVLDTTAEELRDAARAVLKRMKAHRGFANVLGNSGAPPADRAAAARALRHLKEDSSVAALALGLQSDHPDLRRESVHALAVFGAQGAVDALCTALADPSSDVRYLAAVALSQCKGAVVTSALQRRLEMEKDLVVRDELDRALKRASAG